jgi:aminopeptidase N
MKSFFSTLLLFTNILMAQFGSQDSGGKLIPEQACYDVKFYEIDLSICPIEKAIGGSVLITARATQNFQKMVLDLDQNFNLDLIEWLNSDGILSYSHEQGKIKISSHKEIMTDQLFTLKITYNGLPRTSKRPPWDDGFIWQKTKNGFDWVTLTCQGGGADIWLPCKDHPSDEPDSVSLKLTTPDNLICVASGKFISSIQNSNGTKSWKWFVSTPINNYNIMFYIGPYKAIEHDYTSITGEKFPFTVWALQDSYEKAKSHSLQFIKHMKVMEEIIGPYPFRADKYSVVETPHLGMEHQTAIAYGFGWKNHKDFEFDWLHHHEFSHEWWGNLVSAKDWSDFWIHEGLGTYMQPLYLERVFGKDQYIGYLKSIKRFSNQKPVAPHGEKTASESYMLDVYYKGAWIIHTLRYYLGDEIFFKILRRWAYPTPEMELATDGSQCRITTTKELIDIAENVSGKKLEWFFEVYLRQASIPKLHYKIEFQKLTLWWEVENNLHFQLPVEIKIGNEIIQANITTSNSEIMIPINTEFVIDPNESLLMELIKY